MKIRKTLIIIPLIILALSLLLSSPLLLRVFILLAIFELIGFFWALFGGRRIKVQFSKLPEKAYQGDNLTESITVTNEGRMPGLLLKFEEKSDMPGCSNIKDLHLRPKSSMTWQATVECRHRGLFHLGSGTVTAGDPFGLFSRQRHFGQSSKLLVFPSTVELPYFEASMSGVLGSASSGRMTGQSGINAAGVREFTSGDSLTHIHWPTTARSGRLMVKMFDGGRASSASEALYVLLDMNKQSHKGKNVESTEEYAVTAAASLLKKYTDDGLQVGLIVSGSPVVTFPPERGEEHYYRMLEALALVRANGTVAIDEVLGGYLKGLTSDSTLVVVTPATDTLMVDAVRQLRSKEILVSVVSVDPSSFGGQVSSSTVVRLLRWLGVQVYVSSQGEELVKSLDRRIIPSTVQYI